MRKWFEKVLCENEIYVFKIFTLSENRMCLFLLVDQRNTIGSISQIKHR